MATYCYQCDECYEMFEPRASMSKSEKYSKDHRVRCPSCGATGIQKVNIGDGTAIDATGQNGSTPPQVFKSLKIRSTPADIAGVRSEIVDQATRQGYSKSELFALTLGLSEALTNAYAHGNCQVPDKLITVDYRIDDNEAMIRVIDEGLGFDPALVPDPTDEQHIELNHGRGILLMQSLLDEVSFCRKGTCVRLVKRHSHADAAEAMP